MRWHKLLFRQNQPIHLGCGRWGVVNETRLYIAGWTMWGAMTNAFGMMYGWTGEDFENEANRKLFERITCFYPVLDVDDCVVLFPSFKNGKFCLGGYTEKIFRQEFIETYISTAILPESRNAAEGSLHELEVVMPRSKISGDALYWCGLVGLEDSLQIKDFFKDGLELYIGGDARYGLGLMTLCAVHQAEDDDLTEWGLDREGFAIFGSKPLRNYLVFDNSMKFYGHLELVAGFDFFKRQPSVIPADTAYLIVPGSEVETITRKFDLYKGRHRDSSFSPNF